MRIAVTPENREESLTRAVEILRAGGLVAFPTDTVYGIAAAAFSEDAVERLFQAKIRDRGKAIPLLLSRTSQLRDVARNIPSAAWRLADAFWPGGLSIVLEKSPRIPDVVTAGGPTVAVRVPDHPLALRLIDLAGVPLAATSANLSGQPSPVTADEVERSLGRAADLLLDGGPCPGGIASTVIDVTVSPPGILRQGPIRWEDIAPVIGG